MLLISWSWNDVTDIKVFDDVSEDENRPVNKLRNKFFLGTVKPDTHLELKDRKYRDVNLKSISNGSDVSHLQVPSFYKVSYKTFKNAVKAELWTTSEQRPPAYNAHLFEPIF